MSDAHQLLGDSLAALADVCELGQADAAALSPAEQEKQRLQFEQSMTGAKRRLEAAAQLLTKPMACSMVREDAAALERQLSESLAQLNAAVGALAAAASDRKNPDYAAAEKAVNEITSLMPHVVQDSRKLCDYKSDDGHSWLRLRPRSVDVRSVFYGDIPPHRAAGSPMIQDIKALCDASEDLCDSADHPPDLAHAAARFAALSRNLMFYASRRASNDKENEVMDLSANACGNASHLLSLVEQLAELIPDAGAAAELDSRLARAADAAQALLTVAQTTAPTIANPNCQRQLISAAEKLRRCASELTSSCAPHLQQRPEMKQPVLASQQQLDDSLDKLVHACKSAQGVSKLSDAACQQVSQQLSQMQVSEQLGPGAAIFGFF